MSSTAALPATLEDVLARYWGYTQFRPHQREVMDAILAGRDSLLVMPTGGGKSLCFQAPALLKPGLAVVVSPLISLMKDQVDGLNANGVAAACYNSALDEDQKRDVVRAVREGHTRLLYVAPERLVGDGGERFVRWLAQVGVSFIAVDEAHCISQWGHDFRPEYRRLGQIRTLLPQASIHAFTATATGRVRRDIVAQLGLRDALEEVGSFDRPNLVYRVLLRDQLKRQVLDVLGRHRGEAGILYCPSRKEVDALSAWLVEEGWRAVPYHAGLTSDERARNQDAFLTEQADIVVATVAFGMGIHRSNVRFVVHTGAPQSLEHYQQESGRAGRDGLEAECVLITSGADFLKWRVMLEKNGEFTESAQGLLRDIERYTASTRCRHRHLVQYFGETYDRDDCGACDVCLGELEIVDDAVTIARKVLSCVARVEQRFGAAHVANVLVGKSSEAVTARGHAQLSTFGLFASVPVTEVRGYIEQLTALGYLRQTAGEYPVLVLSPEGRTLMRDGASEPPVVLFRQKRRAKDAGPRRSRVETESWEGVDRTLFERLRELRLTLARGRGVPPYVIFHDTTLRDMARLRPTSAEALRDIYGVGQRKAEDVGPAFLEVIRAANPV
ncbi:ATP-dependent DNA helicase RecQ [Luteitalea pratensis]|uniref:DNA helicase RecQ n=1 Tax=Luteitalea pratensis TaxID=1855912 RepID=A0A143PP50_LUTPR|nr:DNA helicase RecQ [Luteitalea pratensis]AMY09898.1 ATP-dependent DNA helicase RecQ [Luteitalea pratensis]